METTNPTTDDGTPVSQDDLDDYFAQHAAAVRDDIVAIDRRTVQAVSDAPFILMGGLAE